MDMVRSKKILAWVAICFWVMAGLIYAVAYPQFRYSVLASDPLSPSFIIGDLVDGVEVRQRVVVPANRLIKLSLMAATYGRENPGEIHFRLEDGSTNTVAEASMSAAAFENGKYTDIPLNPPVAGRKGETMTLILYSEGCPAGNALALYGGNTVSTGRFDVPMNVGEGDRYALNGEPGQGMLCVQLEGVDESQFYRLYWVIIGGAFLLAALLCLVWWKQALRGINNPLVMVCTLLTKYSLLLRQLVSRDFKAKYKRSVLGMAWSFLNPLLTMAVQYIVFSTLFKSDIDNYPIYLLTGIVMMNFFTEAVGMGMTSITGNAALIKKVYMPKYIYPITRVISSSINFLIALLPLFLVMIITRTPFRPSMVLLVFDILCLIGFILGMCLLLTTAMTFFQDTQFLWSVLSMMWMYLTPVFYPERIIPAQLIPYFHLNPMYQYITFARVCIMNGTSPAPMAYFWCIISSLVVLALGVMVFKRNQDRFVLYL